MKIRKKYLVSVIMLLSVLFLCYYEYNLKKGYHEDEIYTIASSNHSIWENGLLDIDGGYLWKDQAILEQEFNSNGNFTFDRFEKGVQAMCFSA